LRNKTQRKRELLIIALGVAILCLLGVVEEAEAEFRTLWFPFVISLFCHDVITHKICAVNAETLRGTLCSCRNVARAVMPHCHLSMQNLELE
jgi:hypothetical protein